MQLFRTDLVKINNNHERSTFMECIHRKNVKKSSQKEKVFNKVLHYSELFPWSSVDTLNKAEVRKKERHCKHTQSHSKQTQRAEKLFIIPSIRLFLFSSQNRPCIYLAAGLHVLTLTNNYLPQVSRKSTGSLHVCCLREEKKKGGKSPFSHQETKTGSDLTLRR